MGAAAGGTTTGPAPGHPALAGEGQPSENPSQELLSRQAFPGHLPQPGQLLGLVFHQHDAGQRAGIGSGLVQKAVKMLPRCPCVHQDQLRLEGARGLRPAPPPREQPSPWG